MIKPAEQQQQQLQWMVMLAIRRQSNMYTYTLYQLVYTEERV